MALKKIVCIGDVFLDIIPSVFPIVKDEILSDGETFVDSVTFQKGGCGGNFSCVLKSVMPMAEVSLVSRVGKLPYSDFLISEIKKFGVIPIFQIDYEERTQVSIGVSYIDGQRHFLTFLGGLKNFTINDIPEEIFTDLHHLAFRGIWFAEKLLLKSELFIKKANTLGVDISIDLGFDPYWNFHKQEFSSQQNMEKRRLAVIETLKYVKFIFGNEIEFMQLTNTKSLEEAINEIINRGVKNIIVHRGNKGCRIIQTSRMNPTKAEFSVDIPALDVEVKNPIGSGDTFDSIFLTEVMEGKTLIQAAAIATAGAAYSLSNPAGTIITIDKIRKFSSQFPVLTPFLNYFKI
ncbi:carbohydrate kinase family protein [Promethearchaeum syntrophicum]|uniref:Carbohydrate kinase family protein n=1 Tax=Promethearchaeum syntrophicum TaxID=2594042 RepID=A0A5B9DBA9_9ARCH|nr:carbohydrate kinase family protein [Candidatus Prometheoarchaeum syntrophicum]QEE16448.1 putative sugar kinase [Candidatus Prometheoarchaeum syntrophicum]